MHRCLDSWFAPRPLLHACSLPLRLTGPFRLDGPDSTRPDPTLSNNQEPSHPRPIASRFRHLDKPTAFRRRISSAATVPYAWLTCFPLFPGPSRSTYPEIAARVPPRKESRPQLPPGYRQTYHRCPWLTNLSPQPSPPPPPPPPLPSTSSSLILPPPCFVLHVPTKPTCRQATRSSPSSPIACRRCDVVRLFCARWSSAIAPCGPRGARYLAATRSPGYSKYLPVLTTVLLFLPPPPPPPLLLLRVHFSPTASSKLTDAKKSHISLLRPA
ncbi:hypothetical protein IWX90DRAFT_127427 [Phyllosticta citrichinensis]|uniref:Uncharacterized protein n=1 Tax=Phyllosticta citrichinensis TaxID=1130410 RepID=A0ABR1Y4I5_9PEZI